MKGQYLTLIKFKTAMIALLIVLFVAFCASSELSEFRKYFPEENNPNRIRRLLVSDANGTLEYMNLMDPHPEVKAAQTDIILYLYTKNNLYDGYPININNVENVASAPNFDPKKANVFLVHGWNDQHTGEMATYIKDATLAVGDVNVFVVGWDDLADENYWSAKRVVPDIGRFLGDFINEMIDHLRLTPDRFSLVGHSLGAHVCGCAGAAVNGKIKTIVGLDPAKLSYTYRNTTNRLDPSDAAFVQIIHTSKLGFSGSIGHADYFPNGGHTQPRCGFDLFGICAHSRSYIYYAESVLQMGFTALACGNYKDFKKGKCNANKLSYLGGFKLHEEAAGDYYLQTAPSPPFGSG